MTRRFTLPAALLCATLLAGACQVLGVGSPSNYEIKAQFPQTIGLYPGSFVRQLGINVGSVSKVVNEGDHVTATMRINKSAKLAENADAILVGDSVLGERYVQFRPAYTGGPAMAAGTVLPQSRVTVPVETDTVLRSLNTVLRGINPTDVRQFTVNLATVLDGQGAQINQLINNAAGTFSLLANKSKDLGQLTTTLAQLTGQLGTRDQALAALIRDYDLLSQTIAADHGQLDAVITQLTDVTTQATGLLAPNLVPIKNDVANLTTIGRTLDRNLNAVSVGLQFAPRLFGAAQRAYDPMHNWLPLNTQSAPGLTTAILGADIRDSLSSICRRLAAKNPGLASGLAACSDPNSSFFNPIIGLLPGLVNQVPGLGPTTPAPVPPTTPSPGRSAAATAGATAATPAAPPVDATTAFAQGLAAIPGLTAADRRALVDKSQQAVPSNAAPELSGPPGAAAVAALAATPPGTAFGTSSGPDPMLGPPPTLVGPPTNHHRGLFARFTNWVGGLL